MIIALITLGVQVMRIKQDIMQLHQPHISVVVNVSPEPTATPSATIAPFRIQKFVPVVTMIPGK